MIKLSCCIPGGSLMPEGVAGVPQSPAACIVEQCRYLLHLGYDCTECAGGMLAGLSEEESDLLIRANEEESLRLIAVNSLFPGDWRLADPEADHAPYRERFRKLFGLMERLGIPYAVFGSGKARSLIEDKPESRETLEVFLHEMAEEAGKRGIIVLIEPLRSAETNICRTVPEAAEVVRTLNDANIRLLYDAFHMAEEKTDLACVSQCGEWLRHCHVAEAPKRTVPGSSDSGDPTYLQRFAGELVKMGYDGAVSVECGYRDFREDAARTLEYLKLFFKENPMFEITPIRELREEPVFLKPSSGSVPAGFTAVTDGTGTFPASPYRDGIIAILSAKKGEKMTLTALCEPDGSASDAPKAELGEGKVAVSVGGRPFADYVFDPAFAKPFFGQVKDGDGNSFTRLDLTTKEHPHQRSLFVAVGDVNGVDCWNEFTGHGFVRNRGIAGVYSGAAYASFTADNQWTDHDGKPLVDERTTYTVYHQSDDCRTLDLSITFTASYGDVTFGPTKEAGPLGIRLRDELRADIGSGQLTNSWGGVGEGECWSRSAEWCDYFGDVAGVGPMGVTVFDCPKNERHPTAWHIRAYGLFAANNLYFKGGFDIPSGESITYRYRIQFRRRMMPQTELSDRYVLYALNPIE